MPPVSDDNVPGDNGKCGDDECRATMVEVVLLKVNRRWNNDVQFVVGLKCKIYKSG